MRFLPIFSSAAIKKPRFFRTWVATPNWRGRCFLEGKRQTQRNLTFSPAAGVAVSGFGNVNSYDIPTMPHDLAVMKITFAGMKAPVKHSKKNLCFLYISIAYENNEG
ncbi:MAG: hypothetical protein V4691_01185 [Pseudomonadota bacterium]